MKTIKVSDETHEMLTSMKQGGESYEELLMRLYKGGGEKIETTGAGFSEFDRNQIKYIESLVMDVKNIVSEHTPPEKNASEATPQRKKAGVAQYDGKLPCCRGSSPCRHWVWDIDSGDGYVHTITGEKREA